MDQQSIDFFKNLKPFLNEQDIFNDSYYCNLPDDWSIIVTDIKNSTQAIQEGYYKNINMIGVASIIAAKNVCSCTQIPFIFGGDGATIFIPNQFALPTLEALKNTQFIAASEFNLDLRVSLISYNDIKMKKGEIFIAKQKLSNSANIAMSKGSGLTMVEEIAKNLSSGPLKLPTKLKQDVHAGFSCKFAPIKAKNGETLTLMIKVINDNFGVYSEILSFLNTCSTHINLEEDFNTIQYSTKSNFNESKLLNIGFKKYFIFLLEVILFHLYANIHNVLKKPLLKFKNLKQNTDQVKFDNILRTVLDVTPQQSTKIQNYLKDLHAKDLIYFGLHSSNTALLTCLVTSAENDHLHFIDGNDGGYSIAARNLKEMVSKNKRAEVA